MNKILIFEDAHNLNEIFTGLFSKFQVDLKIVKDSLEIDKKVLEFDPDLIIADMHIDGLTGIELLEKIRKCNGKVPIIFLTHADYLIKNHSISSANISGLMKTPFEIRPLIEAIKKYVKMELKEEFQPKKEVNLDDQYYPLPINSFISGSILLYDLYLRINQQKYIKLAEIGTEIDRERIKAYIEKGIKILHITKGDYERYFRGLLKVAENLKNHSNNIKMDMIMNISSILENICFSKQIKPEYLADCKKVCEQTFDDILINGNSEILDLIKKFSDKENFHGTTVAFISVMIFKSIKWEFKLNMQKLILAAFLHDIGKRLVSSEILDKSILQMAPNEIKEYKNHVKLGTDLLSEIPHFPGDIISIIQEHHEDFSGGGFPSGLKGKKIHPFARILKIANDFCNMSYKNRKGCRIRDIEEALLKMQRDYNDYDPVFFEAFIGMFKNGEEK